MGKSRILTSSLVFFLSVSMTARADEAAAVHEYSVQLGKTLSEIAQRLFGNPVYPKGGALEKILALNPQSQDANFIRFGQVLRVDGAPNRTLASGEREEVMASSNRNFESGRDVASESTEPSRAVASESPEAMTSSFSELEFAPDFRFVKLEAKDRQTNGMPESCELLSTMLQLGGHELLLIFSN